MHTTCIIHDTRHVHHTPNAQHACHTYTTQHHTYTRHIGIHKAHTWTQWPNTHRNPSQHHGRRRCVWRHTPLTAHTLHAPMVGDGLKRPSPRGSDTPTLLAQRPPPQKKNTFCTLSRPRTVTHTHKKVGMHPDHDMYARDPVCMGVMTQRTHERGPTGMSTEITRTARTHTQALCSHNSLPLKTSYPAGDGQSHRGTGCGDGGGGGSGGPWGVGLP